MNLSTLLVLVFLVGMWIALLVGPVLLRRSSGGSRRGDSIMSFQQELSTLDRNRGRAGRMRPMASPTNVRRLPDRRPPVARRNPLRGRAAAQRRKHIVGSLCGVSFTLLVLSFVGSGLFFWGFVASAALLIAYLGLMFHLLGSQA